MKLPFEHIETPHLVLRPPELGDWPVFLRFIKDERSQFIGGGPQANERDAWRAFGHLVGHWVLRDFGSFIITSKNTGQIIGLTGPWFPMNHPEREIGWSVWDAGMEGKGIAYEAALAAREHAYGTLGWETAVSYIDPKNTRSIALAERLGATLEGTAPKPYDDDQATLVYRHPAPDSDGNPEAYA